MLTLNIIKKAKEKDLGVASLKKERKKTKNELGI
jgi:hypothetical protein